MKQLFFETRQKADELLKEALAVWEQSSQVDALEDIEKDPVFSLMMMALAYQSNELDGEVERLKAEVVEDFARLLVPYEMGHALPASVVVQTALQDDVADLPLNDNNVFLLEGEHPFIPLLETRVLNAKVRSVVRLDGRRWKVSLSFKHPISDLSRFAFAVKDANYRDLTVTLKGQPLPLIRPWEYSELPFSASFAPDSLTYNLGQYCRLSNLPMDLFARQNIRMFFIAPHQPQRFLPVEVDQLDLVFEFSGIPESFLFDKNCLFLNPVLLVNAQVNEASLSAQTPLARLVGPKAKNLSSRAFLHLIRPLENQLFGHTELEVRGVAGDRFNQGSLMKLVNCITTKFHSDFYAFQQLKPHVTENAVYQMEVALSRLKEEGMQDALNNFSGVYLMPRGGRQHLKKDFSLNVKYLTTAGAALNGLLGPESTFTAPSGFQSGATVISAPVPGTDEIRDDAVMASLLRYYMVTGDRLVTLSDIKLFCRKELFVQYGIGDDLIHGISLYKRLQQDGTGCGYEILAHIALSGTSFVKRSMEDKLPQLEFLLEKMVEVRSANIYPFRVQITIEEDNQ